MRNFGRQQEAKKLVLASDLFLDLKLYRIPSWVFDRLYEAFPFMEIVEVDTPRTEHRALPVEAEIYWGNRITQEIISGLPNLKWIHFGSVGVDRALVSEVFRRNILVTNSRGTMVAPTTASALSFIVTLARGFHHCWTQRQSRKFGRHAFDQHFEEIGDLEGQSCLIVGYGDVGKRLAKVCQTLGMSVFCIKREKAAPTELVETFYKLEQLAEAVKDKDFVVNLLPLTSKTRRVFNAQVFRQMKSSAFFINIGRGETVDEKALIAALEERRIAGAGLDVFENEPLPPDSPLLQMETVILTPHVAGVSVRYWGKAIDLMERNIERYLNGEPLFNVVDLVREY